MEKKETVEQIRDELQTFGEVNSANHLLRDIDTVARESETYFASGG